jgi:membrane associated rhomboid family serine protease
VGVDASDFDSPLECGDEAIAFPHLSSSCSEHLRFEPNAALSFLFMLLFVWWMIAPVEERYGPRRTAQLILTAAISSAVPALVVSLVLDGRGVLYSFNPALLAVIAAFAISMKNQMVSLFGVLAMRGIHVLWLALALSFLSFLLSQDFVELVADLGAVAGGVLFMKTLQRPRSKQPPAPRRKRGFNFRLIQGGGDDERPKWLN